MKRFISMFMRDFKVTTRNSFLLVLFILLVAMILTVRLMPKELNIGSDRIVYDGSQNQVFKKYLKQVEKERFNPKNFIDDREEYLQKLKKNKKLTGIEIIERNGIISFQVTSPKGLPENQVIFLKTILEKAALTINKGQVNQNYTIIMLRNQSSSLTMGEKLLPIMLVFEVITLGFFMISVIIFEEIQEGSIKSFRVSPGGIHYYLLSKSAVMTVFSLLYGGLLVLFTVGPTSNFVWIMLIILVASIFMTHMGIAVAVFFHNISEWFFVGVFVLMINMLPIITFSNPSIRNIFFTWLPSYHIIFTVRELLFPTGKTGFILIPIVVLVVWNILCYLLSVVNVHFRLLKEN